MSFYYIYSISETNIETKNNIKETTSHPIVCMSFLLFKKGKVSMYVKWIKALLLFVT